MVNIAAVLKINRRIRNVTWQVQTGTVNFAQVTYWLRNV